MGQYIYYLILLLILFKICREAFHFEKISRFESVLLPLYSIFMFLRTFEPSTKNFIMLVVILLLAILLSIYQGREVEIKKTDDFDKKGRPIFQIKKNKSYLIGWFLIIFIGIGLGAIISGHHLSGENIVEEVIEEIKRDAFTLYFFRAKSTWYIWALTGFSSFFFTQILLRKDKRVAEGIKRIKRKK